MTLGLFALWCAFIVAVIVTVIRLERARRDLEKARRHLEQALAEIQREYAVIVLNRQIADLLVQQGRDRLMEERRH